MAGLGLAYDVTAAEGLGRAWRADAACKGMDTELFFGGRGDWGTEAKDVCAGCPVRAECLEYAMTAGEKWGLWGGLSERQRKRIRSARWRGRAG